MRTALCITITAVLCLLLAPPCFSVELQLDLDDLVNDGELQPEAIAGWPGNHEGLIFLWENGAAANEILDAEGAAVRTSRALPHGAALYTRHFAMDVASGPFIVQDADDLLLEACRETSEITVEALITPFSLTQTGPARIITFSTDGYSRNFTLCQDGNSLKMRLRTPRTGVNGLSPEVTLTRLELLRSHHVIVTYRDGELVCYVNGDRVLTSDVVRGDFSNWEPQHLLFGAEWDGTRPWEGSIEGIAIRNRFTERDEAQEQYQLFAKRLYERRNAEQFVVLARLVAATSAPDPADILPRRVLVAYEYQLEAIISGDIDADTIVVAHWAILDGKRVPIDHEVGQSYRLTLARFEDSPQLAGEFVVDNPYAGRKVYVVERPLPTPPPPEPVVEIDSWPGTYDGLVFLWEADDKENDILDAEGKIIRKSLLLPQDGTDFTPHQGMLLEGGSFIADGVNDLLLESCRRANELAIEALITPANLNQTGPARIVTFSSGIGSRNFTLGQTNDRLMLRLRTPQTGANGANPEVELCRLEADKAHHVIVTYRDGMLVCYLNGERVLASNRVKGDFSNWEAHHLLFGNEPDDTRPWHGSIEGVTIYTRFIGRVEAAQRYKFFAERLAEQEE